MTSSIITKTLTVENMTCAHCENVIEHELSALEGVKSVMASYSKGVVVITYDKNRTDLRKIKEVLALHDYMIQEKVPQKAENGYDITNTIGILLIILAVYIVIKRFGLWNIINLFPVAREGMGYGMLFLIGLLTSVHCVAMCGGICLSQCVTSNKEGNERDNRFSSLKPSFLYNIGRIISYTVIGGIVGALGSVISFSGAMKGIVQIIAGAFMLIMGLNMLNAVPWLRKFSPRMPKAVAKLIYAKRGVSSPFIIGVLNGLMPCGPLQAMQIYALSTGSPVRGALSMFLFSVGTVPLMFTFGVLSSVLNKKYTGKMMTASAVLVLVLGVFMFNSGIALSGFTFPTIPISTEQEASSNIARIDGNVQIVTTGLASGRYEPITVQKGIPVKWIIQAEARDVNGCNNAIIVPKYNLQVGLKEGDNLIEFTPEESGIVPFSCWMGMIRSKITIVDDLNEVNERNQNK